jgi:hypothetical protein
MGLPDVDAPEEPDYDVDSLGADEFALDPEAVDLPDLSDAPPPQPPPDQAQDDLEGLGAPGDSATPPRESLKSIAHDIRTDAGYTPGYCLQYQRIKAGVAAKYEDAKTSLWACDRRHKITDWSRVPRGCVVYFDSPSSEHGHIARSFGGGYIGTTDWPTGKIGRVRGDVLEAAWGYAEAYWAAEINDVIVWRPARKPKPKPEPKTPRVNRVIRILGAVLRDRVRAHNRHDAEAVRRAVKILVRISREAK